MGSWLIHHRTIAGTLAAAVAGAIAWSGHASALAFSFCFLLAFLVQARRSAAYMVALAYYAASSWPLIPGANTFFGPNSNPWQGVALWLTASLLVAIPWGLFFFEAWPARFCSVPVALAATTLPPLGLIGWASPITSAGMLFPGTGWLGITAVLFLPAVVLRRPRVGLVVTAACIAVANILSPGQPPLPKGWEAANTTFGPSNLELSDPIREFRHAEWIQEQALNSNAHVIVFPEAAVSRWNDATEAFWQSALAALAIEGKTIVLGTTVPVAGSPQRLNTVVIRGANGPAAIVQRIPVPISMWQPLGESGYPLRLGDAGTVPIAGQRAGALICYELLLTWPVLSLSLEHPTVLVGVANDYWASRTPIPAVQRAALFAWARLFRLPCLIAVNT